MVFETLVFSPLNHLTWLIAQENFIIFYIMLIKGFILQTTRWFIAGTQIAVYYLHVVSAPQFNTVCLEVLHLLIPLGFGTLSSCV
jgi:hypothetical protein